jgi:hypothetical protein
VRAVFREVHCQQPASAQGNNDDKASDCEKEQRLHVDCAGADLNTEWAALTKYYIPIVTSPTNHMSQGGAACINAVQCDENYDILINVIVEICQA